MIKKMFALASVTALTGLVASIASAGCSSTTTVSGDEAGTGIVEAGKDVKTPVEAGPEEEAGPTTCPSTTPITTADIEANFKWNSPGGVQSVCTQQNIDDLRALFDKGMGSAKYTDIKTTLGATCAACAFTKESGTKWGLFLEDASGKVVFDNSFSACEAIVDSDACGKADAEGNICLDQACADCADQAATDACYAKAAKGACKAPIAAAQAACTADATPCESAISVLSVVCGGGVDGGLDASK
jgi:hypothetical protein